MQIVILAKHAEKIENEEYAMIKKIYNSMRQKIGWFFLGGVALAAAGLMYDPSTIPPINIDGKEVRYDYTDDNSNETLLIYTDQKDYYGFGSIRANFAIKNISGKDQNIKVFISTGDGQEWKDIKRYLGNEIQSYPEVVLSVATIDASVRQLRQKRFPLIALLKLFGKIDPSNILILQLLLRGKRPRMRLRRKKVMHISLRTTKLFISNQG